MTLKSQAFRRFIAVWRTVLCVVLLKCWAGERYIVCVDFADVLCLGTTRLPTFCFVQKVQGVIVVSSEVYSGRSG